MKYRLVFLALFVGFLALSSVCGQGDCRSLNDSVTLYVNTGRFAEAENISERLLTVCEIEVGNKHLDYANALISVAQILMYRKGDFKNALALLLNADTIFIKNEATGTKDYGALMGTIGAAYLYLGDYAGAEKSCREALDLAISTSDSTNLGNRCNSLGVVLFQLAKYDEALPLIEKALILLEKQKSKSSLNYLVSALNYGMMLQKAGKYQNQYELMKEVIPIADTVLAGHPYRGIFWVVWGEANLFTSRYTEALNILEEAKEIQFKALGDQHFEYGRALNSLATALRQVGQYNKALPMQEEAVSLFEKFVGLSNQTTLIGVGNLAILYIEMGEVDKAFTLFERILQEMKAQFGEKNFDYINQQINYTSFLYENGFSQKAAAEARELEKTYRTGYDTVSVSYGRILDALGVTYNSLKRPDSALIFQTRALQVYEKTLGENSFEYTTTLYGLSCAFQQLGKIDTAVAIAKHAIEKMKQNGGGNNPTASRILMHLVELSCTQHQYSTALAYAGEALSLSQKGAGIYSKDHPVIIGRIGRVNEFAGRLSEAFASFQQSVLLSQERIAQIAGIYSYGGEEAFAQQMLPVFENFAGFTHRHPKYQKKSSGILYDNALTLNYLLLQQSRSAIQAARSSTDTAVVNQVRKWNDLKQLWAYQSNLPKPKYNLDSLNHEIERLEQRLISNFLPLKRAHQKISWQKEQAALAPDEAAIQFITFPVDETEGSSIVYYALLLRPGYSHPKMVYLFQENQLVDILDQKPSSAKGMINRLYPYSLDQWSSKQRYSKLYNLVWRPLEKYMNGARRIFYSPSGELFRVSFPAIVKKPGDILADHFDLQYTANMRDLVLHDDTLLGEDIHTAQIFGGIRYETDSSRSTPGFLPATLREMRWLDSLLRAHSIQVDTFSGYNAYEGRIKRYCTDTLRSPHLLHIGTHGYYFRASEKKNSSDEPGLKWADNPMFRSYLLMAGGLNTHLGKMPLRGFEDGLLSAYEIASLNLTGTHLVVLSACQSGLGDLVGNEGVYGLQRAFKIAGVRHLLVSLWKVDDDATQVFMEQFYIHWIENKQNIHVAFRQAQQWMRAQQAYKDPYYWAAFVLI